MPVPKNVLPGTRQVGARQLPDIVGDHVVSLVKPKAPTCITSVDARIMRTNALVPAQTQAIDIDAAMAIAPSEMGIPTKGRREPINAKDAL